MDSNAINLNNALNYTIELLVKWGLLEQKAAIDLEVQMLAKYALKQNQILFAHSFLRQISFESLRRKYLQHQRLRQLNAKMSYTVVCSNRTALTNKVSSVVMPCVKCGQQSADLQLSWHKKSEFDLQLPAYNIVCLDCGHTEEFANDEKIVDNHRVIYEGSEIYS